MAKENTIVTDIVTGIVTGIVGEGRIDAALAKMMPDVSRARLQAMIGGGALQIGGAIITDGASRKFTGQAFALTMPPARPDHAAAQDIDVPVVYEDDHLIVVDKPAGMVVHPSAGHPDGSLVNALLHHCKGSLSGIGGVERPGIVHRIDKGTSGLLVAAKSDKAHEGLAKLFAAHDMDRQYLAIVAGVPTPPAGIIRTQIGRSPHNRLKMAVLTPGKGKHAVTHFRSEEVFRSAALLRCTLETGRTHQVRVHMAHIGHSIIGDPIYANRQKTYKIGPNQSIFDRQALHAAHLGFIHPITGESMAFSSNLPADMQELLTQLRL